MSKPACGSAWMFINRNLRRNALYCYMLAGIFLGVAQIVSHRYYSANWASDLLIARLQLDSLGWAFIFTLTARLLGLLVEGSEKRCGRKKPCLITFIDHVIEIVSRRAAGLALAAASTLAGYTIVVALSGAYFHALFFLLFSLYLLSLGEAAVNPLLKGKQSKAFFPALGVMAGLPLDMNLLS